MHGDTRGPVRVRICCAPFPLLRLLTFHCTRRRGAAEGEGAQQAGKGAADAKACRRRPGAVPRGPRATRSIRPRDRVRGDRRRPRRRHRTDAPCRSPCRSSWIRTRPPPVVRPGPVRSTQCATASTAAPGRPAGTASAGATDPTWSHSPRRRLGRGSTGVIPLTATATTGMTLVSSRTVPPPSSGAGRGRLSGADPAQRPRGRAGGPRSRPPRRRVRQPGSLVMSLLVCCRLVM